MMWQGVLKSIKRLILAGLLGLLIACQPAATNNYQTSAEVAASMVVVPRTMIDDPSTAGFAEKESAQGHFTYYIIVTLFDPKSGARIENATVDLKLTPYGLVPTSLRLMPMTFDGEAVFGDAFFFFIRGPYHVRLDITIPDQAQPATLNFVYDHCDPAPVLRNCRRSSMYSR